MISASQAINAPSASLIIQKIDYQKT